MRAEFRDIDGRVVGTVILDGRGVAVLAPGSRITTEFFETTNVIGPGPKLVKPEEGKRYLQALPFAFRSPYLHAVYVPDRR
jgi:hypothetical protein